MDITPTNTASGVAAAPAASTSTSSSALTSDFETFLRMLTAQARYQDPLEPLDSTEYASQLAQFSAVEQSVLTNDLLTEMTAQLGASNMAQFADWIGKEARTTSPTYFSGDPVTISVNPASAADAMNLVVRNAAGQEVQRLALPASSDPVNWTGQGDDGSSLAPGLYSFEIESLANGNLIRTDPGEVYARITETRIEGGETVLVLEGDAKVASDAVTALREPS